MFRDTPSALSSGKNHFVVGSFGNELLTCELLSTFLDAYLSQWLWPRAQTKLSGLWRQSEWHFIYSRCTQD